MAPTRKPTLVFVAGFLGSGKTTLLLQAARALLAHGRRAALLTNDQSSELVDTAFLAHAGFATAEIPGGCFCCRFTDLIARAGDLARHDPEVIFAEPVGSCTDISATVLQPLKALYHDRFHLAPLTVLVDPATAYAMAQAPDSLVSYLFHKQLAEADFVCLNKIDLDTPASHLPPAFDFALSAKTGEGLAPWLDTVLSGNQSNAAGQHILDIDYSRYAQAEAALGWLNWHAHLELAEPLTAALLIGPWLDNLDQALTENSITIAHCKILDRTATAVLKAGLCRNGGEPSIQGDLIAPPASRHELILNLRAEGDPATMRGIVQNLANDLPGQLTVHLFESFRPPAPQPLHRYPRPLA